MAAARVLSGSLVAPSDVETDVAGAKATRRELWRVALWPLALCCGFLIFMAGSSIYLVVTAGASGDLVNRALQIETKLFVMLSTVRNAEAGQRGYLLTGDPKYLEIYRAAESEIAPQLAELKRVVADPQQRRSLVEIEPLLQRRFAEFAETLRLHEAGDEAAALTLVRSGVGLDLTTEIRARTIEMAEAERRIFSAREKASARISAGLLVVNLTGLALIIVLTAIAIFVMRHMSKSELAYVKELERSNQELDDFAYVASHDLKEPLRGLFNHASFLLEDYKGKIDDDGVRRLNRLGELCQRMERLINDLLYFSRLGRADLTMQEADPNAIIAEIRNMMETALANSNARIVVPLPLPRIICDRTRVTEVFRNLITNAIKYNDKPDRVVVVGFSAYVDTPNGRQKDVFYVRDNGIGIDPEFHQEIFRIFKRLQNATEGDGTGVGLTFVKKIVERHGGRIWLNSEVGQGTAFYFNLSDGQSTSNRNADGTQSD